MPSSATSTICSFPSNNSPGIAEVGGKGYSLIQLSKFMPVPAGFVLTTRFFVPWWSELSKTDEWKRFLAAGNEQMSFACSQLKNQVMLFAFSDEQNYQISNLLQQFPDQQLFAVRSSSPEEDLEGTSFAGAYETVLGVSRKNIQAAVRACFASCLDYRIVAYKREHGLDVKSPKIAVVIQKQIASEVSGVAFSLNPLTNDFDEAIINANFGLGETVVAGDVTPDSFVVDKVNLVVKEFTLGAKQRIIRLAAAGGTTGTDSTPAESQQSCLSKSQVIEVTRLVSAVESRNAKAMDIEWAFENGKLYLLQARPVTAYQPLPPDLVTLPGRARRLYLDGTRSVQGIERPLSEMGASMIKQMLSRVSTFACDRDITDHIDRTLPYVTAGRVYLNLSNAFSLSPKEQLVKKLQLMDPLAAKAVESVDEALYKPSENALRSVPLLLIKRIPTLVTRYLGARVYPENTRDEIMRDLEEYRQELLVIKGSRLQLRDFTERVMDLVAELVFSRLILVLASGIGALGKITKLAGPELAADVALLTRALPGNVTVEMGLELYDVAQTLPSDATADNLGERLQKRELPQEFLTRWDSCIGKYGHRAPEELDIATKRYREDSAFLINQLISLSSTRGTDFNPRTKYEEAVKAREQAFLRIKYVLMERGRIDAMKFDATYRVLTSFLGLRETPKFCLILAIDAIRQRVIEAGAYLVSQGRLDSVDQVFELSFEQLCSALEGHAIELRTVVNANRVRRVRLKLNTMPKIFDSRGRIIRAPVVVTSGNELAGSPISPGSVKGTARVLHSPDEKALNPGDILVARATDPGWTPLFATAAAVVLEVGGVLQHGALVAREYGLPCVAGIHNVTERIKDGSTIEVDGTNGIVRILD